MSITLNRAPVAPGSVQVLRVEWQAAPQASPAPEGVWVDTNVGWQGPGDQQPPWASVERDRQKLLSDPRSLPMLVGRLGPGGDLAPGVLYQSSGGRAVGSLVGLWRVDQLRAWRQTSLMVGANAGVVNGTASLGFVETRYTITAP
jgi:hypothetical protein